jgi:hypothetical protein
MVNEAWKEYTGKNEKVFILTLPILKIREWLKKRKRAKVKVDYEWIYDGCGCTPDRGYLSNPYCNEHYSKLIRVPKEIL